MKKLLRNSLIASVVAVAGAITGAGASFAQDLEVEFSGNVPEPPAACTFTPTVASGTLVKDGEFLSSQRSGAQGARYNIACNESINISVSQPVDNGSDVDLTTQPGFDRAMGIVNPVRNWPLGGFSDGAGARAVGGPIDADIAVDMAIVMDSPEQIVPGNYAYKVTVTATPQ